MLVSLFTVGNFSFSLFSLSFRIKKTAEIKHNSGHLSFTAEHALSDNNPISLVSEIHCKLIHFVSKIERVTKILKPIKQSLKERLKWE